MNAVNSLSEEDCGSCPIAGEGPLTAKVNEQLASSMWKHLNLNTQNKETYLDDQKKYKNIRKGG